MSFRDWASTTAGLVLASIGLTAFAMSGGGGEVAPAPATVAATVPQAPPATTETVVIETPVPQADVPVLSAATDRVLQAGGFAAAGDAEALGLPPAVVEVLEDAGVVLVVPGEVAP